MAMTDPKPARSRFQKLRRMAAYTLTTFAVLCWLALYGWLYWRFNEPIEAWVGRQWWIVRQAVDLIGGCWLFWLVLLALPAYYTAEQVWHLVAGGAFGRFHQIVVPARPRPAAERENLAGCGESGLCPECRLKYGWDGVWCRHCQPYRAKLAADRGPDGTPE